MLNVLWWISNDPSPVLTQQEVNVLFEFTRQMADIGQLSDGKYAGANRPLYWQRLKGSN